MFEPLLWWILVELIGLAVWPVAHHLFRNLPDRGYAFSKPLGLLLIAYLHWLLTTLGVLENTPGAIALLIVLTAAGSWWWQRRAPSPGLMTNLSVSEPVPPSMERASVAAKAPKRVVAAGGRPGAGSGPAIQTEGAPVRKSRRAAEPSPSREASPEGRMPEAASDPLAWLRDHAKLVLAIELVFTAGFALWVAVRAFMPEITATEKPMEFAFLNAILQSRHWPPQDPWLAGYAISYYYFGYVIMAMLTMVSGIPSSIAFNLAVALLFGLAASGAFGLVYNLIKAFRCDLPEGQALFFPLFAPLLLLVMGNLEGLFESLHSRGVGSTAFWEWLDIKGLSNVPVTGGFVPTDNWWWWRASRVVHDVARGQTQEVIDEFPQFSFLLGDMHPHVLALPFVLLALAVALNLMIGRLPERTEDAPWWVQWRERFVRPDFLLTCVIVGALPFLNFWDILPYGFIVVAGYAVARYRSVKEWSRAATRDVMAFVVVLGITSLLLYLPFYLGFQSQAGGILPVLFVKTRLHQYLIMFGLFVFVFAAFLVRLAYEYRRVLSRQWLNRATPFLLAALVFPLAVGVVVLILLAASSSIRDQVRLTIPEAAGDPIRGVLSAYLAPLAADPWLYLLLTALLVAVLVLLRTRVMDLKGEPSVTFVLLLMFTGLLLTFGVEFVYLRDVFGTRMNTVFKFYFQSWTLFAVAGAFAIYYLSRSLRGFARGAWFVGLAALMGASLIYPALAIPDRAEGWQRTATLDGTAWIRNYSPGDYAGIEWLKANAPARSRILEATGRQYSYDDRISMATGLPTVLGWIGHEDQWRGGSKLYKDDAAGIDRAADVARIYQTLDAREALTYLDKYAINFVVVGQVERSTYALTGTQVDKFSKVLKLVFENGDLRLYARSQ